MSTLKNLFWYLRRPKLYPQLLFLLQRKLRKRTSTPRDTREEASLWCAERAIGRDEAVRNLTGLTAPEPFEELFPLELQSAHLRADACPIKMGGPGDLSLLYWSAEHLRAQKVIETGVAYGWSSLAILLSLRTRDGSVLISTDRPYPGVNNDAHVGCVVPEELRQKWKLLRFADRSGLPRAIRMAETIDMCHYDSDKSEEGRLWAYPILWEALRPGGFLISDDIGDNVAFRDFCLAAGSTPVVILGDGKYIGVLVKPHRTQA